MLVSTLVLLTVLLCVSNIVCLTKRVSLLFHVSISDHSNVAVDAIFELQHYEVEQWKSVCVRFCEKYNLNSESMLPVIADKLRQVGYNLDENGQIYTDVEHSPVSSHYAVKLLLDSAKRQHFEKLLKSSNSTGQCGKDSDLLPIFSGTDVAEVGRYDIMRDIHFLMAYQRAITMKVNNCRGEVTETTDMDSSFFIENSAAADIPYVNASPVVDGDTSISNKFDAGQCEPFISAPHSRFVHTGGTIALNYLYLRLKLLKYNVLLCNEINHDDAECSSPDDPDAIIVTGEWCKGVLEDYQIQGASNTQRRGIQYHLGFHHMSDMCRGHITVPVSHYLYNSLQGVNKIQSSYFLGTEMVFSARKSLTHLLEDLYDVDFVESPDTSVLKENIILFDPDIETDYPLEEAIGFLIPPGFQFIRVQQIPREQMPLLLERAKIILDLAMPGAERITMEGILVGAVPIISDRWNGASSVDFPGVLKVSPDNAVEISEALLWVATHYDDALKGQYPIRMNSVTTDWVPDVASKLDKDNHLWTVNNALFFSYIVSMWRRADNTINGIFGSSNMHFMMTARSLKEEILCNFQILATLFFFPMSSIDVYVKDVKWYYRHHYSFLSILKTSGYLSFDPFDPEDSQYWEVLLTQQKTSFRAKGERPNSRSFLSIKSLTSLESFLDSSNEQVYGNTGDVLKGSIDARLADTSLVPSWNPLFVYLTPGVVISDPFQFLDETSLISLTRHTLLYRPLAYDFGCSADVSTAACSLSLLLASPNSPVFDGTVLLALNNHTSEVDSVNQSIASYLSNGIQKPHNSLTGVDRCSVDLTETVGPRSHNMHQQFDGGISLRSLCGLIVQSSDTECNSNDSQDKLSQIIAMDGWHHLLRNTKETFGLVRLCRDYTRGK